MEHYSTQEQRHSWKCKIGCVNCHLLSSLVCWSLLDHLSLRRQLSFSIELGKRSNVDFICAIIWLTDSSWVSLKIVLVWILSSREEPCTNLAFLFWVVWRLSRSFSVGSESTILTLPIFPKTDFSAKEVKLISTY